MIRISEEETKSISAKVKATETELMFNVSAPENGLIHRASIRILFQYKLPGYDAGVRVTLEPWRRNSELTPDGPVFRPAACLPARCVWLTAPCLPAIILYGTCSDTGLRIKLRGERWRGGGGWTLNHFDNPERSLSGDEFKAELNDWVAAEPSTVQPLTEESPAAHGGQVPEAEDKKPPAEPQTP